MAKSIDQNDRVFHPKSESCLSSDRIHALLEDLLTPMEAAEVEEHLSTCEYCRTHLEAEFGVPQGWSVAKETLSESSLKDSSHPLGDSDPADWKHLLGPTDDSSKLGRIGNYEVVGLIGRGGMGVVFKAFDAALNRYVAIKMLAPYLATSGAARKRFAREAQAAAAVVDDNVLPIYGVDQWQGVPYFVMQYSRGITLQKRLQDQGHLDLKEILRIGVQTAKGLAAAHAQGLVHRDVKPSNILLDASVERVLLCDFGLARAVDDASLTRTGAITGTPQYMSPEQVSGAVIDARSDLFSLGCVLYAICTGRPPFRAESSYAILRQITDHEPRSIRQLNPEIPDWFEAIVSKLMAKSSADRFGSAVEVSELLGQCLAHVQQPQINRLPIIPDHSSPVAPLSTFSRFQTRLGVIAMSIVASVALLAAMIVIQSDRPSLTVFGTKPSAENGTADVKKKAATTPALIIESQKIEAENDSGEGGRYTWKLKGESVENMTIRVLHIENGKTSIVSESVYQGGTPGEQRIEVELKLKDSQEPMPSPGNMLTPTLAVSVNGLQAKAETGEKFIFPGAFQGHSESNNGPIASGKVLGWFAYNHKEVEVDGTLESIVEASKNSAAFLVTTVDWKGYEQTPTKEITDDINDIQGTWQVTSLESEGALIMEDSIHELQHVFAGNALTQIVGKKQNLTEFELDPSVSPKTIDIVSKGKTQFGIYELDGDNLRLCLADPRPKEFDSRNGRTIATFKRVAKKTVERKDNGYSLEGITIRETQLTSDGQLEITYETLVESMWYCPGANGVMGQEGLELTFPRVFYNKKIDVDYPSSNKKESTVRTIKVDPKNKPVFIVSNEKRVKIWEPNDKVQIHQDSAQPRDPELPGAGAPQESLSEDQRVESDKTVDLRKLLEQAIANERSKELVVRIGACMGEADNDVPKDAKELVELWEFTSGGVHRVKWDYKEGRPIYRRLESRNCDFEEVCQELLNGRALEIRERKGTGPETVLAGTPYGRGSRSIEVECEGKIVLELHETNGPIFDAYPESDAIAFGKLYDQLAMRARAVLGPKAGEISKLNWRGSGMVEKFAFKGGFFLSLNEKIPGGLKSTPKAISLPRYGVLKISPQGRTVPIYVMLDAATGQPGTLYVNRKADGEMLAETGHPMTRLSGKNRNGEEWSWHCTEVSLELPFAEGNRNANVKFMRANQDKEYFETDIGYISDYGYAGTATIHGKPIPTMVHILDGHANLNCWFDFNGDGIIDPNEKVEQDDSFLFEGRWWSVVSVGNDGTIRLDAPSMYLDKKETITADQAVALEKRLEENPDARDFRYALRQLFMYYRDEVKDKQKAMAILEREYQYAIANLNSKDIKRMLREQFFCCVGAEAQEQALVALEREHAFLIKEARRDYSALSENLRDWVYRLTKANDTVGIAKAKELMLRAREELVGATNKEVVAQLFAVCEGYCSRPKIGDTLDIAFTALDGTKVDLATMKGKVVLVDFWATWCAPCVASQPEIKAAYEKYHDKGFEVIGISLDDAENKDKVVDLLKDKKLPWPQSFDGKGWETPAAVTYGISAIPATFLIDKEGKVIALNLHGVDLETKLAELLK